MLLRCNYIVFLRVLFGTDQPFFPPLDEGIGEWMGVKINFDAIEGALDGDSEGALASSILRMPYFWLRLAHGSGYCT